MARAGSRGRLYFTNIYVCVYVYISRVFFFQRTCVQVRNFGREGSTLREGVPTVMANLFSDPRAFQKKTFL